MIKNILVFLFLLSFSYLSQAQEKENRNTVTLFYTPILTNGALYTEESSWVSDGFYRTQPPSRFFHGYQVGIDYSRKIKRNIVSISYRFTLRGQQTSHYFNNAFSPPEDSPENYGGGIWDTRLTSNEFILGLEHPFYHNISKGIMVGIKAAVSIDIYNNFIIQDYIILKDTGIKRLGCCSSSNGLNPNRLFSHLGENFTNGHFRVGFILMMPVRLNLVSDIVNISLTPEIEYLTRMMEEINLISNRGHGHLLSAGIQIGLGISF